MLRGALLSLLLVPAAAPLMAQRHDDPCRDHWGDNDRPSVCHMLELSATATGSLRIDPGVNGGAEVESYTGNEVQVKAYITSWAGSDADAQSLNTQVKVTLQNGVLQADGPSDRHSDRWAVMFVVRVPQTQDLEVETTNGPISVDGVSGTLRLETVNGPVDLEGVSGDVHARLQNGPLTVALKGTEWKGTGLDASTVNGPLTISVPENYNAQLESGTTNGPLTAEIPMTVQTAGGRRRQTLSTTFGRGGATLRAVTTNGPLTIRRGR